MPLTLELYNGESTENIEAKLVKLQIDYPDLKNANRLTLFVYQLFTAIYYIKVIINNNNDSQNNIKI